ncbi:MAG: Two-component sensor histidine kinase [Phycisphaerales bacterium]|nr:Two-component sensor histidine kinase [Phycisphaerales bacterium]
MGRATLGAPVHTGSGRMRLTEFIAANVEPVLVEWEKFARGVWPEGTPVEPEELRDSAAEILRAVVAEMGTAQSLHEQQEKSAGRRGAGGTESDRLDDASTVHGADRVGSGMPLESVVAEYRALRASVLRLWRAGRPDPDPRDLDDVTRFNEAVDQSLARAVDSFGRRVDESRRLFLAVLGHDLRNPLAAITLSAKLARVSLTDPSKRDQLPEWLTQIVDSAKAAGVLLKDLIDFTGSSMGVRLPLAPGPASLGTLCEEVCRETHAAFPDRQVRCTCAGGLDGVWDAHRLRQAISNLLSNAIQHGAADEPVELRADGTDADTVVVSVRNAGTPIPADVLPNIFDPLVRGPTRVEHRRRPGSIGLGLYIVREVAAAHGGTASLASTRETGTIATVRLPRDVRK